MHPRLNKATALGIVCVALLWTIPAGGTILEHTVTFSQQALKFSRVQGYDFITLQDCDILRDVGRPQLPDKPVTLALPGDVRVLAVRVVHTES